MIEKSFFAIPLSRDIIVFLSFVNSCHQPVNLANDCRLISIIELDRRHALSGYQKNVYCPANEYTFWWQEIFSLVLASGTVCQLRCRKHGLHR